MFMSNFSSKEAANRSADEFTRYCREEGLDELMILSRLSERKETGQKKRKQEGYLRKLLRRSVMVVR